MQSHHAVFNKNKKGNKTKAEGKEIVLILLLVDCGIELIPNQLKDHPAVLKNLKTDDFTTRLLDNALHHSAMKGLTDFDKRGRPDIVHLCLLNAIGSTLNKNGHLRTYMHTLHGDVFKIDPSVRLPRNYNRFKGLMAQLLHDHRIKFEDTELISTVDGSLKSVLQEFQDPFIILFSRKGKLTLNYREIFPKDRVKNVVVVIGGFQKGTFSSDVLGLANNMVSVSEHPLDAWIVVSKVIEHYELFLG